MREYTVDRIRAFNRFYLPAMDLLGNHYLGSEYSATEARVIYEIYACDGCSAMQIARTLRIDKSYLSRILRRHEQSGYLVRERSLADSRTFHLHLTELGRMRTEDFIEKSNQQIGEIIASLDEAQCGRLVEALKTATDILDTCRRKEDGA